VEHISLACRNARLGCYCLSLPMRPEHCKLQEVKFYRTGLQKIDLLQIGFSYSDDSYLRTFFDLRVSAVKNFYVCNNFHGIVSLCVFHCQSIIFAGWVRAYP